MIPAGVHDLPSEEYHRGESTRGSLSYSDAKLLLPPSCPAKFRWAKDHPKDKPEFDFGKAAHLLVLGDLTETVAVLDFDNRRTSAYKAAEQEAREAGRIPILREDYERIEAMAAVLKDHPIAGRLYDPDRGEPEKSLIWLDGPTGITRRCRLDWLPNWTSSKGRMILPDYKTTASAWPADFAKSAANFGYALQAYTYSQAITALGLAKDVAFVFVAQEREAPYVVSVIELDHEATLIGELLNAIQNCRLASCKSADCSCSVLLTIQPPNARSGRHHEP